MYGFSGKEPAVNMLLYNYVPTYIHHVHIPYTYLCQLVWSAIYLCQLGGYNTAAAVVGISEMFSLSML